MEIAKNKAWLAHQMTMQANKALYAEMTPKEEKAATSDTVRILLYYTVLNVTVSDIKFEFDEMGLYRHRAKKTINEVEDIVVCLFNRLRRRLLDNDPVTTRKYDQINPFAGAKVEEAILLTAPERSVNIALATCRLMMKCNDALDRFCVPEVLPLHQNVIRRLESLGVKDYHIDSIIERTIAQMVG